MSGKYEEVRRRRPDFSRAIAAVAALALFLAVGYAFAQPPAPADKYAPPANSTLPPSDMQLDLERTALVVSDPQNDFLMANAVWTTDEAVARLQAKKPVASGVAPASGTSRLRTGDLS